MLVSYHIATIGIVQYTTPRLALFSSIRSIHIPILFTRHEGVPKIIAPPLSLRGMSFVKCGVGVPVRRRLPFINALKIQSILFRKTATHIANFIVVRWIG